MVVKLDHIDLLQEFSDAWDHIGAQLIGSDDARLPRQVMAEIVGYLLLIRSHLRRFDHAMRPIDLVAGTSGCFDQIAIGSCSSKERMMIVQDLRGITAAILSGDDAILRGAAGFPNPGMRIKQLMVAAFNEISDRALLPADRKVIASASG